MSEGDQFNCALDKVMYKAWINAKLLNASLSGGNSEYIKTLLEAGADVNASDKRTWNTALMYTAQNGDYRSMKVLLDAGADTERRRDFNTTALMEAASNKPDCLECVKLLIQAGADVYARNNQGRCPLLLASLAGHYNIVHLLLEKGKNVDACDNEGRCALSLACLAGHDQVMKLLIDSGADVNFASDKGMTPLMHAANKGSFKCTKLLLEAGADMSLCDNYGNSTIMWATTCNNHNLSCIALLKQAGATFTVQDLNASNSLDDTPLMYASYNGDFKSIKALIEAGAHLECRKQNGYTSLLCAARNKLGCPDCVNLLIESGADVNACDNNGYDALLLASANGYNKIIQVLLDIGRNVNMTSFNGKTSIFLACLAGYDDTVKLLVESGADVNLASTDGTTPLMLAANKGNVKCAIHQLKAGADIDLEDKYGNTALVWALTSNFNNHSCVCLLAQAGASQPAKTSNQCSTMLNSVKKHLLQDSGQLDLQHQCRKVIRRHLLWINEYSNLVATVSQLPLPTAIKSYLLYYVQNDTKSKKSWMNSLSFFADSLYDTLPKPRMITDVQKKYPQKQNNTDDIQKQNILKKQEIKIKGPKTKGYRRMALLCEGNMTT